LPSRYEIVYCSGDCATTQLHGSCPPIPLRRDNEYNIICKCSDKYPYMNCMDSNKLEYREMMKASIIEEYLRATTTKVEDVKVDDQLNQLRAVETMTSTTTLKSSKSTSFTAYQPFLCAIEKKIFHNVIYPLLYIVKYSNIFNRAIKSNYMRRHQQVTQISSSSSSTSSLPSSSSSSNLPLSIEKMEINLLSDKKMNIHIKSTSSNSSITTKSIVNTEQHQLISYSFTIENSLISFIGITPQRYYSSSSIIHQTREIIDEIMCSRIQYGSNIHILIFLDLYKYEEFIKLLHTYVDLFIIDYHLIYGSTNKSNDYDIDRVHGSSSSSSSSSSDKHGSLLDSEYMMIDSCDGNWHAGDSDKVVVIRHRNQSAVINLMLTNAQQYTLTSNII